MDTHHENISHRAHEIWIEAGRPEGQETAHWLQAERELSAKHGKPAIPNPARGKSVEPPAPAKHVPEKAPHSTNYAPPGVTTDSLHHRRTG